METLKSKLLKNDDRPTDVDLVLWYLGQVLGLFPENGNFENYKNLFLEDNSLLRCLVEVLDALEMGGLLKVSEESYGDYKWEDPEKVYFYKIHSEEVNFVDLTRTQ